MRLELDGRRAGQLGSLLVAFGAVGIVLVVAAFVMLVVAGPSIDQLGGVSDRAGPTRQALADASRTLDDLSTSARSLGQTLTSSSTSLHDASAASTSLADALSAVAAALDVQVLGSRPFAGAGERLSAAAVQVRLVADDLTSLSDRLSDHSGDAGRIADDAATLRTRVDAIDATLAGPPGLGLAGSVAVVRLVLLGILAWLGALAAACVVAGRRLRRLAVGGR